METRILDGNTFRRLLVGGAQGIREHIQIINDLNVFPVPDGDTGTNMSKTIDSGIAGISHEADLPLPRVASDFARGSLLGARGNSGVILSQFFAGMCGALAGKDTATPRELADAYVAGVTRSYKAVAAPVEGTILTVFRESANYAREHIADDGTLEEFLRLHIEEAERSLARTKDILPVLTEADVVDSGGAGYLCIAKGMYETLEGKEIDFSLAPSRDEPAPHVNYDLFTADSQLTYGYCTECLVRLQNAKGDPHAFDLQAFTQALEAAGCDSIVTLRDGDVLKVHAHTKTPACILTLCQTYGEFLNVKIENMSLQHSEQVKKTKPPHLKTNKPSKPYGVVTVATGEGMTALFESLGADVVINGGQTGNPSAEEFLAAFTSLNAKQILVLPNNSNIWLTALQAKELWGKDNVCVLPTKTLPQGYAALSVFNPAVTSVEDQLSDLTDAMDAVVSAEVTVAVRDSSLGGMDIKAGAYIGILDGELTVTAEDAVTAVSEVIQSISDIDDRELVTLFVGAGVSEEQRVAVTEAVEEAFPDLGVEVYLGGQEVYDFLIAVE